MYKRKPWEVMVITISIIFGICMFIMLGYSALIMGAFGLFDKTYDPQELVENFNDKKKNIYELKHYFNSIIPAGKRVAIEFEGYNNIARLDIYPLTTSDTADLTGFTDWHLRIGSKKVDSLLASLGWSNETLSIIEQKLDDANCIYIESGEPSKIGFKRSGLVMYSFNVFDKPMNDSVRKSYQDDCVFLYANNRLILEYGGGAIGPQCFPDQSSDKK